MTDQRQISRAKTFFRPACIEYGDIRHVAMLRDISPDGAGLVGSLPLRVGQQVDVRWSSNAPVSATVRWIKDGRFGLAADFSEYLAPSPYNYRALRVPIGLPVRLHTDGETQSGELLNMSQAGLALALAKPVRKGSYATIECGRESFECATIKWERDGVAGVRLAEGLRLEHFSRLVEQSCSYSRVAA